ncbi:fatty acid synthase-like [Battus philenor]|uniref:fatty acid synthase-like n=1 Tax=Battus philenor TaxID=42288 RepID=UPI0035D139D9
MVPTPQKLDTPCKGMENGDGVADRVVISGMSGLYPDSHHVKDLADILYNKKNPISSNPRWKYNHPEVAQYAGKVPDLHLFDAQFFKVHYRLGHTMDSMSRKLLEQAYQAIYDAGLNPESLSGRKIGVFVGTCFSETEKASFYISKTRTGFGIAGCNKAMFANRISYWLNAKGPSMSIDESCCSSLAALEQAYLAMSRGDCEAAIVGGGNICLLPQSSIHFGRIMNMSMDGKTRSFDEKATGCVRSEAINVLFLQKAKDALRIYADVIHVQSRYTRLLDGEFGPKFGFCRDPTDMTKFLNDFYKDARVSPKEVEYVEAFGSAVPDADKAELDSIDAVFCKDRNDQLLVGSIMSNIGYCEAASGISSVTKVLLGYHTGTLAANLNFESPRQDVEALREGRLRIVDEHQPFGRSYVGVNGLTITGVNAHILLHGHYKPKDLSRYKSNIPYLVTISARQDSSVKKILGELKSRPIDPEELALFHNIHQSRISGHLGRGYTILSTNEAGETVCLSEQADYFDDAQPPLWFVYSGMGSQWTGMGTQLMRIPIFSAAIERCRQVLEPLGVDIVNIITSPDETTFDNILNSFVGIAAIQIGLTDVLQELGLVPDNIIGHSVGELGCAYADGSVTAEEMILAAYYRGLVSLQTPLIRGSMAAVGIGYEEVVKMCPPEIEVACHNGPDSSTISGPADIMKEFVAELTAKQIFAKEVPCSNIAYHSRYIADAGSGLMKYLSQVIKTPKPRSERWLSTSVPQERWNEPIAKHSSAEYFTNNLLNPVLFEETSRLIPPNAVLVEIAPHGLLQAILKRSLPETCHLIPITRRGHPDIVNFLLEALGKLYMEGYNPKVQALYPKIEFPVSTGTPFLSHFVEWAHHEKWNVLSHVSANRRVSTLCKLVYSIHDQESKYLTGNILRGKNTLPFSAALTAAWDVLAMTLGAPKKQLSVQFQDLKLYSQPLLHDRRQLRLIVTIHRGTGYFEITDEITRIITGYIKGEIDDLKPVKTDDSLSEDLDLESEDIYEILRKKGYGYRDEFQSIHKANKSLSEAEIYWRGNWTTFIDAILQLSVLRDPRDSVLEPTHIRKLTINTDKHSRCQTKSVGDCHVMNAKFNESLNLVSCGGVIVEEVNLRNLPPVKKEFDFMSLKFVPYFQQTGTDFTTAMLLYLQIVAENLNKSSINIIELSDSNNGNSKFENLVQVFNMIPSLKVEHKIFSRKQVLEERDHFLSDIDLLLATNLSDDDKLCQTLYRVLCRDTFIVNNEYCASDSLNRPSALYRIVSAQKINEQRLELIKWRPTSTAMATSAFTVRTASDLALLTSTQAALPPRHKLLIITSHPVIDGLKDLVQEWRKERNQIHVVMINQKISEDQNIDQLPNLDLTFNVLENGQWGGEFYVPLRPKLSTSCDITLESSESGNLNSLRWVELPNVKSPGIPVTVHYAGLNDIDVKLCSGMISHGNDENKFGMDFSGITSSGNRVMGIVSGGAASTRVSARPQLLWPVPDHWTLEDAATVPLAYCLAFYCLEIRGQLDSDMNVLIHGGAGALGQAAISIALAKGCNVFTTVSDISKKRFLRRLFPLLKEEQIGNSRDHTFADMVLTATNGKGCNLILSSVEGGLKNASLKCVAAYGTMFDTNQIKTVDNFSYGMFNMTCSRNYTAIDFTQVLKQGTADELRTIQMMLSDGIKRGCVRPLSRVVYGPTDVSRAFRLLAGSNHRGRVLLQLQGANKVDVTVPSQLRVHCSPESSHLILCNYDYLGLRIAEMLTKRGARKIYLHGLKRTGYLDFEIRSLEKLGAKIVFSNEMLTSSKDVNTLLNNCNNLGTVEGVYMIATNEQARGSFNIIQELDSVTRKLCPKLRYFGAINSNTDSGIQTCLSRAQDKLPATMIILPSIDKMNEDVTSQEYSDRNIVDVFERALRSNEPVIIPRPRFTQTKSLVDTIAELAAIEIPNDVDIDTTLADLNITEKMYQIISSFLRDMYHISIPEIDIPRLTIRRIREIESDITDAEFEEKMGVDAFYSCIDSDELVASTEMVFLPTQANSSVTRDDEFDVNQTYLCLIPGMEGHHERFRTLCERLKIPAIVLQPGLDCPNETISDQACRYAETLVKKAALKGNFYLLGYENGILVALEMVAILEDKGMTGTVFCLGGTPEEFLISFKEQLKGYHTDHELQIAIARHMYNLVTSGQTGYERKREELETTLKGASTWQEKVEACVRSITGGVTLSAQYARQLFESAYGRIKQIQNYNLVQRTLRSKIIFITTSSIDNPELPLQNYSQQPIAVYKLRAPLSRATADLRCSAIINNHLDTRLLEAFEKQNLCDTYIYNNESFMTMSSETD